MGLPMTAIRRLESAGQARRSRLAHGREEVASKMNVKHMKRPEKNVKRIRGRQSSSRRQVK